MPNEEEIRKIMAKAKKAAGGKGSPHKEAKEKLDSGGGEEEAPTYFPQGGKAGTPSSTSRSSNSCPKKLH